MDRKTDCEKILREKCPEVTPLTVSQMDYYLVGQDALADGSCQEAILAYNQCVEEQKRKRENMIEYDSEYMKIVNKVMNEGTWKLNERTGKKCLFYHGDMMKFDLSSGHFPLLTTKKMLYKAMIGELIGFLRGVNNAKDFRDLRCNFWNANANESKHWLENPNRKGEDDLGRIYGVQARDWQNPEGETVDQLKIVIDKLKNGVDDRRLIVTHWNPGELGKMALPPCHMTYQFGIRDGHLDMCMYQRSCDIPLGIPMNIASYSLLLILVSKIVGLKPGVFTHFMWNIHIYEDQYEQIKTQIGRKPFEAPTIKINRDISSLDDIENNLEIDDIEFVNYEHHDAIKFAFSE